MLGAHNAVHFSNTWALSYLKSAAAESQHRQTEKKLERQRVKERGWDGGRAQSQQDTLHYGALREK